MKVNELENQCFVFVLFFSCYPNWFLDFLQFYVTLPLGHLMQIKAMWSHFRLWKDPALRNKHYVYEHVKNRFLNHFLKFCDLLIQTSSRQAGEGS